MERGSWRFLKTFLPLVFALHPYFCHAEKAPNYSFVREATSAPRVSYHRIIVVGGGTTGCPLAATLSFKTSVLVLERGGSPYTKPGRTDKVNFLIQLYDTSSDSYSQQFFSEDGVSCHRARVLGGGSVINGGFYSHADPQFIKEAGLDEDSVRKAYEWVEKKLAFRSPVLQWQSAVKAGLLEAGVSPFNQFTNEHIKGTKIGATIFDENDHRHTAADLLEYAEPESIKVYLHATVHKIIFTTGTGGSRPRATGVIYEDARGVRHEAYLTKDSKSEVILSAGAIGSPQLLMLSGIGPARQLQAMGIKVVKDQPMVGQNLADNAMNGIMVPSPLPVEVSLLSTVGITQSDNYIEAWSGLNLPSSPGQMRTPVPPVINKMYMEAKKKFGSSLNTRLPGGVIIQKAGRPLSTGHMELRSTNPNDTPKVWFNYFQKPEDVKMCERGMETIIKVVNSKSFSRFRYPSISTPDLLNLTAALPSNLRPRHPNTATSLEQFCRDTQMTFWHYHGSCQVGKGRPCRVLGVDGLRVIDASTFHVTPGTNPQATVMMLGSFVQEATSAPSLSYHSYIVVGGGAAGCPLAATLSEKTNVLVLERGGSPYLIPGKTDKVNFLLGLYDTSNESYAQHFYSEDGVSSQRARVLGGGTVINAGYYSHADPKFIEETRLDQVLVKDSYQWVEKKVAFEPPILQWQSAVRDGLLEAGVQPYNNFTYEHIVGTKIAATIFDENDHRHTAADLLEYAEPKNIKVYLHATVHQIIFTTGTDGSRQRATGVIYEDASGVRHEAHLTKDSNSEIILSSGAIGSPQLLMLSGIGPAHQLEAMGIKVVMDQPMVGQNMADNALNGIIVPSPLPVETSLLSIVGITQSDNYIEAWSGLNLLPVPRQMRTPLPPIIYQVYNKSRIKVGKSLDTRLQGGYIIEKAGRPLSTGHIELRSTDPNETPKVWFNYFREVEDVKMCVRGMKTIIKVVNSKAFSRFRYPSISTLDLLKLTAALPSNLRPRHPNTATSLKQFCRDTPMTFWHYHGSCQVGKVVDNDYRVLGIDGLRVIDASTFHVTPGTNPQATVMMLGRHTAADLLEYADPKNIKVYLHATVHQIIFTTGTDGSRPRATAVIYEDASGVKHEAHLTKDSKSEIIVSSGAIGSPQLLMLSGIGPARQLEAMGIKVVMDQPTADNALNSIVVPSPLPVEASLLSIVGITQSDNYIEAWSGLNLLPVPRHMRTPLPPIIYQVYKESRIKVGKSFDTRLQGGYIFQKSGRPLSTGHIELRSTDPNETPKVWFNYFKEAKDVKMCVRGMETIIKVVNSKSFSRFRYPSISTPDLLNLTAALPSNLRPRHPNTATSLEHFCRDTSTTFWHYHGSCQVGKVVDNDYRVLGIDSLRVIDASTFHVTPGTSPQATVMMLGR
ncbi:hypothetical protein V6N13_042050 [Hibiscus sabdariffa]